MFVPLLLRSRSSTSSYTRAIKLPTIAHEFLVYFVLLLKVVVFLVFDRENDQPFPENENRKHKRCNGRSRNTKGKRKEGRLGDWRLEREGCMKALIL